MGFLPFFSLVFLFCFLSTITFIFNYYSFSLVAFPHLPGSTPSWPSLVDTSKQWDYYSRREKENAPERGRGSVITVPRRASSTGMFSAQGFIHVCFICISEFLFSARMGNPIQLGKDCLTSSEDSHFKSIKAVV